jgi:uncharacterized coiled-coil protein SlyX
MKTDIEFYQSSVDFWAEQTAYDETLLHEFNTELLNMFARLDKVRANLKNDQVKLSYWRSRLIAAQKETVCPPPQV